MQGHIFFWHLHFFPDPPPGASRRGAEACEWPTPRKSSYGAKRQLSATLPGRTWVMYGPLARLARPPSTPK